MRRFPTSAALVPLALGLLACASAREPSPAERVPLVFGAGEHAPLPDEADLLAARIATLALAGRTEQAAALIDRTRGYDADRRVSGQRESGLVDDEQHLLAAVHGEPGYSAFARRMLESGDPDPVLERRLRAYLDAQPLERAKHRLSEHRRLRIGEIVNRVTAPLGRIAMGGLLQPLESGRAALSALLVTHSMPEMSTQERQALRAYEDFLNRHPDAPEADWVTGRVRDYRAELHEELEEEALEFAETALDAHQPQTAIAHLERAGRLERPDDDALALWERAGAQLVHQEQDLRRSFRADDEPDLPARPQRGAFEDLVGAVLVAPLPEAARLAREFDELDAPVFDDELRFIQTWDRLDPLDEDAFFADMSEIAELDPAESNMARHAARVVHDPEQNPYASYRAAKSADTRARVGWIFLASRARGPADRDLPAPLEWLIDLPGFITGFATFPIRLLQYPGARRQFGGPVTGAGERYLVHFPRGEHAEEVRSELEGLANVKQRYSRALHYQEQRDEPDPSVIADYRAKVAERTFQLAEQHPRIDVRAAIYREVVVEYGDTPYGAKAEAALYQLMSESTPQNIRLSRDFLEENPRLTEPDALGLRPELFDGDGENGELAEDGVTLLGQTLVRVDLDGAEPATMAVPPENFARFVALLEEESYRRLLADERELPEPDLQRDLFFERARLGMLEQPDMRPTASSQAVYLSSTEKYGIVKRRDSILPVELVLQGSVEDLGLAAFPRVTPPKRTPDAFLYR